MHTSELAAFVIGAYTVGSTVFFAVFFILLALCTGLLIFWWIQIRKPVTLVRLKENPILKPVREHWWESEAVFNPAAFYHDGRVHLFYRAMGHDGISRIGYASSKDGIHFDVRLPYPVFEPRMGFGLPSQDKRYGPLTYDTIAYSSGGGWGGCEDPKVTKIGNRIYMTYVNNNGWDDLRVAITSISVEDFNSGRWNWSSPRIMSRPGEINKSAVLMSQKIQQKFVIFHRVFPNILIDHLGSLDFPPGTYLEAKDQIPVRKDVWDGRKISIAASPIRIREGWLAIYHAVDDKDPGKYKIGAMILDADDPARVLYRSHAPILSPDTWYENEPKHGVVYPSGAVVVGNELLVYYGGGDKYVAVARTHLPDFVHQLMTNQNAVLTPFGK